MISKEPGIMVIWIIEKNDFDLIGGCLYLVLIIAAISLLSMKIKNGLVSSLDKMLYCI